MEPLNELDAATRTLSSIAALVPDDRRVEFWQRLTTFCAGPDGINDVRKLAKIRRLVDNEDDPGEYPDDIYSMSGGNIDDAFSVGLSYGEELFALQIRKILDA